MSKLFLMCGVPGSGKTTYIKENAAPNSVHVSRDVVRFSMLNDNDDYFAKEKEVFKEWIKRIQTALDAGRDVYADATHLNKNSRNKTLSNLNLKNHELHAICIITSEETCILRNLQRKGRECVPTNVIKDMFNVYTIPYLTEGYLPYKSITMVGGGTEY